MEYIQLLSFICCIYIIIKNLEDISLVEGFYSVLDKGKNVGGELGEFSDEMQKRMKKENRGYMVLIHSINIVCIVTTIFIIEF